MDDWLQLGLAPEIVLSIWCLLLIDFGFVYEFFTMCSCY